ncbi:MAG: glucosaminidase domain-containing protein [Bacteroidales bacterium]|nr:glucosaminidase domain-containing protein [Bacteroidales bacterium]
MKKFINTKIAILSFLLFSVSNLLAQQRMSTEDYIDLYKDVAIKKMKEFKIPASITLAQGILESGSGNSSLAKKANNHFGIKCHKGWTGKKFYMDDDEKHECFRKYKHASDSYRDHSQFLTQRGRYSFLFDYKITDYKKWAHGLKKAGYATNPKYPELLIRIIEKYHLDQYDKKRSGGKSKPKEKVTDAQTITFIAPSVSDFAKAGTSPTGRIVYINNGKKLIVVEQGDTFYGLAEEFEIYSWQLFKYNEVDKKHILQIGELVYLEKKKSKAERSHKIHVVSEGESMRYISQLYGIKLKKLYKLNRLPKGRQPQAGDTLKLR